MSIYKNNITLDKAPEAWSQQSLMDVEEGRCNICGKYGFVFVKTNTNGVKEKTCNLCRRRNARM